MTKNKDAMVFKATIGAGTTSTFSERIKGDGTVESLYVGFYVGQLKQLHVYPYILKKRSGIRHPLVKFPVGTDQFLSGDDERIPFDIVVPCENDDQIVIVATNTAAFDCTLDAVVGVDYQAGQERA